MVKLAKYFSDILRVLKYVHVTKKIFHFSYTATYDDTR